MKTSTVLLLIILCLALSHNVSAQPSFTKTNSKEFIEEFQNTNLIERIDMNRMRVYVNDVAWNYQLNAEHKEMFVNLVADYFKHHHPEWNSDSRPSAEIYSNRTAKRVARWSIWRGVQFD